MENKMVEPSNKKILIAILVLVFIIGTISLVVWGYVKHLPSGVFSNSNTQGETEGGESFQLDVPDDWEYAPKDIDAGLGNPTRHYDSYLSPIISNAACASVSTDQLGGHYSDRFVIDVQVYAFQPGETFEDYLKFNEAYSRPSHPNQLILLEELEIGGASVFTVNMLEQSASLKKCNINRFMGFALAKDGKFFQVTAYGPNANYEQDFKTIFHSIRLKWNH